MSDTRSWKSFWKKILDWLKGNKPTDPVVPPNPPTPPDPVVPPTPIPSTQRASFLFDNAGTRAMNALSYNASDDWVNNVRKRQKANGDWTVWLYMSNDKDGSPNPTTIYDALFGGSVSAERVGMCRRRMKDYKDAGFSIVAWLTADDSSKISNASLAVHKQFINDVHNHLGDLIDAYCVGLEMDEDSRASKAKALIAHAKAVTKKEVGVHLTTGKWQEAINWGADVLYYQAGFGKTASQVKSECANVISKLNGRCKFVLAEYHVSSDSAAAKAIGQEAMKVTNCLGTGNGR